MSSGWTLSTPLISHLGDMDSGGREYTYPKLGSDADSIRLVDVLPGSFDDPIRLRIFNANARECSEPEKRLDLHQVRLTLPEGWKVRESSEGRFLFGRFKGRWQQNHPDDSVEKWKYMLAEDNVEQHKTSDQNPRLQYDALSYTWGSSEQADSAVVHHPQDDPADSSQVSLLKITRNLSDALRHLRHEQHTRTLWVDAICINQEDESEKYIQIRQMDSIYRRAHRVVIFLGPAGEGSQLALSTLSYLGAQVSFESTGKRCPSTNAVQKDWYRMRHDLGWDDATWTAILHLLRRSWFSRLWIIQEVRLAGRRSVIQCGHDSVSLFLFQRAMNCLKGKYWLPSAELRSCVDAAASLLVYSPVLSLSELLSLARQRACFNPRDKVFGILSLIPGTVASKLSTPYSRLPAEIYRDMFLAHLRHTRRLELFQFCYQAGRKLDCPSWVPDLSSTLPVSVSCTPQFASGCSKAHFRFTSPGLLELLGVSAATVSEVSEPLLPDSEDAVDKIRSWQPRDMMTGDYLTGISLLHAHAITLRMNRYSDRRPGQKMKLQTWLDKNSDIGLWGENNDPIPPEARSGFAMAIRHCEGRVYIRTQEGHIGLAPLDTKPGDVVAVFLGCTNPIVLRPEMESEQQRFRLIAECFVLGLHDAISLLGPLPTPWRVRESLDLGDRPRMRQYFINSDTMEKTVEDPRLGPLGAWKRLDHNSGVSEAEICDYFQNEETGQVTDSDPRLLPGALVKRGVKLRCFWLI